MSFNIFAAGTRGFNYTRNNCADGDLFEAAAVMNALRAAGPSPVGVAEGVMDYTLPSAESQARTGIQAHLHTAFLAHLRQAVELLAMCPQASHGGWIAVSASRQRMAGLWPAATGFARYDFRPNIDPALEFMTLVLPVLASARMNNWGVLREIDIALRRNHTHIFNARTGSCRGQPMIQIQLFE